jgi:hypothetical protein
MGNLLYQLFTGKHYKHIIMTQTYKYKLFDSAFAELGELLLSELTWLDTAYGKAVTLHHKLTDNRDIKYPAYYHQNKEYLSMLPAESYGNYCFFILSDPISTIEAVKRQPLKLQADISIIFWADMSSIQDNNLDIKSELESDVLEALNTLHMEDSRITINTLYETPERAWSGYNLDEVNAKYFMYPYTSFRIDCELIIKQQCYA